jgi:hypothetical protein
MKERFMKKNDYERVAFDEIEVDLSARDLCLVLLIIVIIFLAIFGF